MTTDELHQILSETEVEQETREKILAAAKQLEEEKKAERQSTPKTKKQWVVVLKTPLQPDEPNVDLNESVAHVFQVPEDSDPNELLESIRKAGVEQNLSATRKKILLEDFDDVTNIKRKFLKEENVDLKSKDDWVRVIPLPFGFEFGGYENPKFD